MVVPKHPLSCALILAFAARDRAGQMRQNNGSQIQAKFIIPRTLREANFKSLDDVDSEMPIKIEKSWRFSWRIFVHFLVNSILTSL